MAHYFIFPEKDAAIYSHPTNQSLNTGIDEILTLRDIASNTDTNYYPSRFLVQFKTKDFVDVINDKVGNKDLITASFKAYQTEHRELIGDQHLEIYPLAESWVNGTGRLSNTPQTTNGVSWKFRDGSDNSFSNTFGTAWTTSSFTAGTTGSFISDAKGGGVWYTGSGFEVERTYGFNDEIDISLDITTPVLKHYSASNNSATYPSGIANNGFIIKRSGSQEFTTKDDGELNFFSMDTHTIYSPHLDFAWDDSSYDTVTHGITDDKILKTGEIYITLRNNKEKYRTVEEPTFRLNVRELYPTRKFTTTSNYLDVKYFTSKSFYSLVDYATEETVIPFDENTKLSADSEGMYFKMYMNGLQEERYYKLLFKHENNDGIKVFDENCYFKIVKS